MSKRLVFIDDGVPGITRRKLRGKWAYFGPDGKRIEDRDEIDRLNAIALPPAYTDAWFAPDPQAHLQAIGYDARGRKQYRYHPEFRLEQEMRKFELCAEFGRLLPALRKRVSDDLSGRKLTRERAIASVVALLDTGKIRVGNECYVKANKSFGATTLRKRHAKLASGKLKLRFSGKGGQLHEIASTDRRLIRCVRSMQDLRGQHLFRYLDEEGAARPVCSEDVNDYLHETMGEQFTARNFRTWHASAIAFELLWTRRDISLRAMMEEVSRRLHNTPAVARKSYVHPAIVAAARDGAMGARLPEKLPRKTRWLSRRERGLLEFLDAISAGGGD